MHFSYIHYNYLSSVDVPQKFKLKLIIAKFFLHNNSRKELYITNYSMLEPCSHRYNHLRRQCNDD